MTQDTNTASVAAEREKFIQWHMENLHSSEMMAALVWDNGHFLALCWRAALASAAAPAEQPDTAYAALPDAPTASDAMVDAYLKAQREAVEEADRFGRPNIGGLHTNTVREACRAGLNAALEADRASRGQAPAAGAVAGWQWVPVEPTHEMLAAASIMRWRYDALLAASPTPPTQAAPSVLEDAARYRWLAAHCRSTSEHWGGRWSIVVDGPAPELENGEYLIDEAIDAARKQGGAA